MVCSRGMFAFIDDPEGPNLLIVTVLAVFIYFMSFPVYRHNVLSSKVTESKRVILTIIAQVLLTASIYVVLQFV